MTVQLTWPYSTRNERRALVPTRFQPSTVWHDISKNQMKGARLKPHKSARNLQEKAGYKTDGKTHLLGPLLFLRRLFLHCCAGNFRRDTSVIWATLMPIQVDWQLNGWGWGEELGGRSLHLFFGIQLDVPPRNSTN